MRRLPLLLLIAACSGSTDSYRRSASFALAPADAQMKLEMPDLRFGEIPVGGDAGIRLLMRSNGYYDFELQNISLVGSDADQFSLEWTAGTMPPGKLTSMYVHFRPTVPGTFGVRLSVETTAGNNNQIRFCGVGGTATDQCAQFFLGP